MENPEPKLTLPIAFDLASHHALGGGSYVFKSKFPDYLKTLLPDPKARLEINIIIQPNSSPHAGTLCSLGLAFVLARKMKDIGVDTSVVCDLWNRAKGVEVVINNVTYQRSLSDVGIFEETRPDYEEILAALSEKYGIACKIRLEEEFLRSEGMGDIIQDIIFNREELGKNLQPDSGKLAIRAACPECGLVDKYGTNNVYALDGSTVSFLCPQHGWSTWSTHLDTHRFQFNCQLFNLVIGRYYEWVSHNYIQICGSDYAGFWQEQLLWRNLINPIMIVYTPLITDWSGSKLSKSRYLQADAYDYLKKAGQEYLLCYQVFKREKKDLNVLWKEVEDWVEHPYKLFRSYTVHYLHLLFEGERLSLGVIHDEDNDSKHRQKTKVEGLGTEETEHDE